MGRITLEEFVADNELNEMNDLPEEELAEQEQVAQSETIEAGNETEELITNQDRSIDTVEALESLREAMESKGPLTETDLKLMRIATEMAVAGTGIAITSVVPSLESNDPQIALEGFGDRIKDIVVKIGENIGRIFRAVKNFFAKILLSFRSAGGRVRKLLDKAKAIKQSGKKNSDSFSIRYRDIFILGNGNRVKSIDELKKELAVTFSTLDSAVGAITDNAGYNMKEYGVLATLKDLGKIKETGEKFYGFVDTLANGIVKDMKMKKSGRGFNSDIYTSKDNLGGYGFELRIPEKSSYNRNDYAAMKASISLFKFQLHRHVDEFDGENLDTSAFKIDGISIDSVIKMLEGLQDALVTQTRHTEKLIEMYNAASLKAEGAIRVVIGLLAALISGVAINAASGVVKAHLTAQQPLVIGAVSGMTTALLGEVLFSFKAMSKNNAFIYNSIEGCYEMFRHVAEQATWACADILNKGRWQ